MSNPHFENRVRELEKLHWPGGKPHDHPELGVHDPRARSYNYGARTTIHPSAVICPGTTIGNDCHIGPNVVIGWAGFGYTTDEQGVHHRRPHPFGVVICNNVEIGAGTVIDRGRYRDTLIGTGTKIDANVFIAHNCLIGRHCLIIANSQISGSCEIGDHCHIGPAAMLTDHVKVGDRGRCGMGAVVIRDVPPGVTVVGNPAKNIEERRAKPLPEPRAPHVMVGKYGEPPKSVFPDGSEWDSAFGDGSDDLSLPVAREVFRPDIFPGGIRTDPPQDNSEIGQRQRAAKQGWMGATRGPRG